MVGLWDNWMCVWVNLQPREAHRFHVWTLNSDPGDPRAVLLRNTGESVHNTHRGSDAELSVRGEWNIQIAAGGAISGVLAAQREHNKSAGVCKCCSLMFVVPLLLWVAAQTPGFLHRLALVCRDGRYSPTVHKAKGKRKSGACWWWNGSKKTKSIFLSHKATSGKKNLTHSLVPDYHMWDISSTNN